MRKKIRAKLIVEVETDIYDGDFLESEETVAYMFEEDLAESIISGANGDIKLTDCYDILSVEVYEGE